MSVHGATSGPRVGTNSVPAVPNGQYQNVFTSVFTENMPWGADSACMPINVRGLHITAERNRTDTRVRFPGRAKSAAGRDFIGIF